MRDLTIEGGVLIRARVSPDGAVGGSLPVLDGRGLVALPGLVEAHCHLDKTLFGRPWVPHLAEDSLTSRVTTDRTHRARLGIPDPIAMRALLAQMAATGTSLVRSHTDVDPEVGLLGIERVRDVASEVAHVIEVQQVAFPQHGLHANPGTLDLMAAALAEGAQVVGGLDPTSDGDARDYLDAIFALAERHGAKVDLHLHARGDVGLQELDLVIERTKTLHMAGRVAVSHLYCVGDLDLDGVRALADKLASAGVGVVTAAPYSFPVPPIRELMAAGVVVGCGHDGIRDLWGPYGTGDMLDRTRHIAMRSGYRSDADIELVLAAATSGGRRLLVGEAGGIVEGRRADLILVPSSCAAEAVVAAPPRRRVVRGRLR
ncbi:UNVERIFIED_CONTAM: hypothetical protein LK11_54735 [Mumia flava]